MKHLLDISMCIRAATRSDVRNAASAPTQAEARRWNLDIPVRRAHENCAQEGG